MNKSHNSAKCGNLTVHFLSQGDSGGPLVCLHNDGRYYLHGITSYGTTTCAVGLPGVYTKVNIEDDLLALTKKKKLKV